MYESKVSLVKTESWDKFSVMKNSSVRTGGFIPVPCPTHNDYSITNICKSPGCIEPLCPQCITAHIQLHQKTKKPAKIQNIINTRIACIQKLSIILQEENLEIKKYEKSCLQPMEGFVEKNRKKIEFAKNKIVNFVENYFEQIEEKLEILETAYRNQQEKKSKEIKNKIAPLLSHIQEIFQYKAELQSEDYIPALIQLLNDPPKKPAALIKPQFENYGEVKIDEYSFESLKTSVQSFVSVQSLLPAQNKFSEQISQNSLKFSNQMQFSRLGRPSSRQLIETRLQNSQNQANLSRSNSRKKIFSNQKKQNCSQLYNSSFKNSCQQKPKQGQKATIGFQTNFKEISLIDKNYFTYDNGLLAYFPQNRSYFYFVNALSADIGFERCDLPKDFVIPFDHRSIVTPGCRLFLIGGRSGTKYCSDCNQIIIKESKNYESTVKRFNSMKEPRTKFGSVFYKDFIFVFGGKGQNNRLLSSCERYNIQTNNWENIASMSQSLMDLNVCVFNEKIIKFGGISESGQILNRVDFYYPETNSWIEFGSQIPFFIKMGCCQINKCEMIIFGGETQFSSKRNECFLLREQGREIFKLYSCLNTLYNEGSFQASYVYKNSLLAIQDGEGGKNKIIMKLQHGKWRFLSC